MELSPISLHDVFDQRSPLILLTKDLHLVQKSTFKPFISGLMSLDIVEPCLLTPL